MEETRAASIRFWDRVWLRQQIHRWTGRLSTKPGDRVNFRESSLVQNSLQSFVARILFFALTFGTGVLTARWLGPSGKGTYALVQMACQWGIVALSLGIPVFNGCFARRPGYSAERLLGNSAAWAVISAGAVALGGLGIYVLRGRLWPEQWPYILAALSLVPPGLFVQHVSQTLRGANRILAQNALQLVLPGAALVLLLVLVVGLGRGLPGALASLWLAYAAAVLIALRLARRLAPGLWRPDRALLRESIRFGGQAWAGQVFSANTLRLDLMLVGLLLGSAGAGYYAVAMTVTSVLLFVPQAVGTALLPRLVSDDVGAAARLAGQSIRYSLAAAVLGGGALIVAGRWLIPFVFGQAYRGSIAPMIWLLPATASLAAAMITNEYFNATVRRPLINTGLVAVTQVLMLAMQLLLTPRLGLIGAAQATSIAWVLSTALGLALFVRTSGLQWHELLLPQRDDWHLLKRMLVSVQAVVRTAKA